MLKLAAIHIIKHHRNISSKFALAYLGIIGDKVSYKKTLLACIFAKTVPHFHSLCLLVLLVPV